jgi:hypothetical protein
MFSDEWIGSLKSVYHLNTFDHQIPFSDNEWWNEVELRYHYLPEISFAFKGGTIYRNENWNMLAELGVQYFYD